MKKILKLTGLTLTLLVLAAQEQPVLHITVVADDDGDTSSGACHLRDAARIAESLERDTEGRWDISDEYGTACVEQRRYPEITGMMFFTLTDDNGTGHPLSPQDRAHLARELRALSA